MTDKSGQFLAYINTKWQRQQFLFGIGNPSTDNGMPYSPAGEFDNLSLTELESILTSHLKLAEVKITSTKGFQNPAHMLSIIVTYKEVMTTIKPPSSVIQFIEKLGKVFGYK